MSSVWVLRCLRMTVEEPEKLNSGLLPPCWRR
jgi:hypothetical protein